jgi:glycosyltransferase involved in cell wall biosynthesis
VYRKLLEVRADRGERQARTREVREWQHGYGAGNTAARMSERYLGLYQEVMASRRQLQPARRKRTAFVMKGRFPDVPPTAYVRLVDWKAWFEREYGQPVDYVEWGTLLGSDVACYSKVVIQRDAVPAERVGTVVDALRRFGVDYIYEMDDDLFDVPDSVDRDGAYKAYAGVLPHLCANAARIHVTNEKLAARCRDYNDNVVVRPNKISRSRWKMDALEGERVVKDLGLPSGQVKVLYFGSKTHQEDIEFALDAIGRVRESGIDMKMYVVGGADAIRQEGDLIERISPPSHRYDHFVEWLVKVAGNFDFGVAPLLESAFSASKSHLKLIEYLAVGLPVICSDLPPYAEMKGRLGPGVSFVPNDIEAWVECLRLQGTQQRACPRRPVSLLGDAFVNDW